MYGGDVKQIENNITIGRPTTGLFDDLLRYFNNINSFFVDGIF